MFYFISNIIVPGKYIEGHQFLITTRLTKFRDVKLQMQ